MSNQTALGALDYILDKTSPHVGIFNVDWKLWALNNEHAAQSIRFNTLIRKANTSDGTGENSIAMAICKELEPMSDTEKQEYVEKILREGLSKVLRLTPEKIDVKQNLNNMGIDSLMMLELTLIIQSTFGIEMPTMELLKQPTLRQVAENILNKLLAVAEMHSELINTDVDNLAAATG